MGGVHRGQAESEYAWQEERATEPAAIAAGYRDDPGPGARAPALGSSQAGDSDASDGVCRPEGSSGGRSTRDYHHAIGHQHSGSRSRPITRNTVVSCVAVYSTLWVAGRCGVLPGASNSTRMRSRPRGPGFRLAVSVTVMRGHIGHKPKSTPKSPTRHDDTRPSIPRARTGTVSVSHLRTRSLRRG